MRALTIACLLVAAAGTAGAASNHGDQVANTLNLTNWGLGVFYLHDTGLGQESNGLEGWQEAPVNTPHGVVHGDLLVLP